MAGLAKTMTDDEMKVAAVWLRIDQMDHLDPSDRNGTGAKDTNPRKSISSDRKGAKIEPIAGRIIEVPEDEEQSEGLRNPRSGFIAYVPMGSLKRGESLVTTGSAFTADGKIVPGETLACAICHGPDLMGLTDSPGIAGRSPSYLVRQLYDIQHGTRKGKLAPLMQPVVARLTPDDMVAIAAYVTSRGAAAPSLAP